MSEEEQASKLQVEMLKKIRAMNKTNAVNRLENIYFKQPSWAVDGAPYPWAEEFHNAGKHKRCTCREFTLNGGRVECGIDLLNALRRHLQTS